MDGGRFDTLARTLSMTTARRGTLRLLAGLTLGRMVATSPDLDAGKSAIVKRELRKRYPWFKAPSLEPTVIDGVTVRVRELTGEAGDVAFMLPWTLHNVSLNCADQPRFMVTHTVYSGARSDGVAAEIASDVESS